MQYVCPQTCPKNLRNGPCGGTNNSKCEVEDKPCIWVGVYERAKAAGRIDDLQTYVPPPRRDLKGTSSWINYFLARDSRPGNFIPLTDFLHPPASATGQRLAEASKTRTPTAESPAVKEASDRS
jgi:hypothetical protein